MQRGQIMEPKRIILKYSPRISLHIFLSWDPKRKQHRLAGWQRRAEDSMFEGALVRSGAGYSHSHCLEVGVWTFPATRPCSAAWCIFLHVHQVRRNTEAEWMSKRCVPVSSSGIGWLGSARTSVYFWQPITCKTQMLDNSIGKVSLPEKTLF